jgi:tetratricopeptide (TPR) repeat protein
VEALVNFNSFLLFLFCSIAFCFQAPAQTDQVSLEKINSDQNYLTTLILKKNYQSAIKYLRQKYSKYNDLQILSQIKNIYLQTQNSSGWAAYLAKTHAENNRDVLVVFELAKLDISNKKYDLAIEKANDLLAIAPSAELAFETYISVYYEQADYKKVIELYDNYIQLIPKQDLYLRRAHIYYILKNYVRAQNDLDLFTSKNRSSEDAHLLQVQLFEKRGLFSQVNSQYKKCLVDFPESKVCRQQFTLLDRKLNQQYLIQHFDKHRDLLSKNRDIVIDTAKIYEDVGQMNKAEELFQLAANFDTSSFDSMLPLLQFYERQKLNSKLLQSLKKMDQVEPENIQISEYIRTVFSKNINLIAGVGLSQVKTEQLSMNAETGEKLTELKNPGRELFLMEEYKQLLKNKKLLVANDQSYYFRLGVVYYKMKQFENAISAWKKVSKDSSSYVSSLQNLSILLAKDGYKTKAVNLLKTQALGYNNDESTTDLVQFIQQHISGVGRKPSNANEFKTNILMRMNLGWE